MGNRNGLEKKISLIKEITGAIASTSNLHSIANVILDLALSYTKAKSGSILLLDPKGDLVVSAAKGMDPELMHTIRVKVGDLICGRVAKNKTPLLVKDIEENTKVKRNRLQKYKTKSFISSPILKKDKLLGVINISDKTDGSPFTNDEFDLIKILAHQASISLEHARLVSELRSKASELDERNKGLIDSDILKTEFITKISHELRTPLNSIKGAVYYLKEKKPSETERAEFINIVSDETDKLIVLLNELLSFSYIENKHLPFRKKLLNIQDILEEAVSDKIIKDAISEKNITVHVMRTAHRPDVIGEKISILQSCIHIIDGISNFTEPEDHIEIRVQSTQKAVKVIFLLKGKKLPDSELSLLFDERALWYGAAVDENKMKFYLARKAVDLHKGSISVSNASRGFTLSLVFTKNEAEYRHAAVNELMNLFISFIARVMDVRKCSLMLFDENLEHMTIRSAIGLNEKIMRETRVAAGSGLSGWVAEHNKTLLVDDIEKNAPLKRKNASQYTTPSLLCVPINLHKKTVGVLNLNNKTNNRKMEREDFYLASVMAERISYLIGKVVDNGIKDDAFNLLVKEVESLSSAKEKHRNGSTQVSDLVMNIMQGLNQGEDDIKLALYASRIYDLGMTQLDESIISKSEELSEIEKKIIKTHPFPGVKLIDSVEHDDAVKRIILHHHERYDGSGYPSGLKGDSIPFISRVLAVADSYAAMVTDRPYRKAVSRKQALRTIKAAAGALFDPAVVDVFSKVV